MRPSDNRLSLWPIAVIGIFIVVTLVSFHTGYRLRENVPGEFRDYAAYGGKPDPTTAAQYWQLTCDTVQWKYGFGASLPVAPPPEFKLPDNAARKPAAEASRQMYWARLRRLWERPEIWKRYYDFDPSWSWKAVQQTVDGVAEFFRMSTH